MKSIWFFLRPFAGLIFSRKARALIDTAVAVVTEIQDENRWMGDEDKRECALDVIKKRLKNRDIDASEIQINGAIEAAVWKMKQKRGRFGTH